MHSITAQLRHKLGENMTPLNTYQGDYNSSAEDKFMLHFETINKVNIQNNKKDRIESKEERFAQALNQYSTKGSPIDSIIQINEDTVPLETVSAPLVQAPTIPNLLPSSYVEIKMTSLMFQGVATKQNYDHHNKLPVIEVYSEFLRDIGRRNKAQENKILTRSKIMVKSPTYQDLNGKQIQTDPKEFDSLSRHPAEKLRKKDLILMEILSEKKRKTFATDYFTIMELKLMELLDFILQDEPSYIGLDPSVKIKTVLKNLQHFQGKSIEGESKINLLRIFFQEFTGLKKQKDELEALKTPMKKVENKERVKSGSKNKFRETRQTISTTPQRKLTQGKGKKDPQYAWIQNTYGHQAKMPMTQPKDEWIGSL